VPLYYFHIRDGETLIVDEEGIPFPTLDAARAEAARSVREMLAEQLRTGEEVNGQVIKIADESGAVVETLAFTDVLQGHMPSKRRS
jgi:hypothetical protein